jgi:hypothetical protein
MNKKKGMLILTALVVLTVAMVVMPGSDDHVDAAVIDTDGQDLATLLNNAKTGDVVNMTSDATLNRNAFMDNGVTLNTNGYVLTIPLSVTLTNEGTINSTNMLIIEGTIVVFGGTLNIDGEMEFSGLIDVRRSESIRGTLNIGTKTDTTVNGVGNSRISIAGYGEMGYGSYKAIVLVRNLFVSGEINISAQSQVHVLGELRVGNAPILTADMVNDTIFKGSVALDLNTTHAVVYGKSTFNLSNLKNPSVNTEFRIGSDTYAKEYMNANGIRNVTLFSAEELVDQKLQSWRDAAGNIVTEETGARIGSTGYTTLTGEITTREYTLTLVEDTNIRWIVNGIAQGSSGSMSIAYNNSVTVNARLASGDGEIPVLKKDGAVYEPNTSFRMTNDAVFSTSNASESGGFDLVFALIVFSVLMVAILAIVVIIKKKNLKW